MADTGRPPVITEAVLQKLEEAFLMGCSDKEACLYADIAPATLYNYQTANPEFVERKATLKENPILLARSTVFKSLKQPQSAQWYLERKKKDEFSTRVENTGKDGKDLIPQPILGSIHVPTNNSHEEDSPAQEADSSGTGRDISQQDDIDTPLADPSSPDRQDTDSD